MIIINKKIVIIGATLLIVVALILFISKYNTIKAKNSEYEILVDVEESMLYLMQDKKLVKKYQCSGGKWSTPSPIGTWKITEKAKWGEGFGGSWMRNKCTMGKVWNTWHIRKIFYRLGKFTWMYKNEK